MAILVTGAAGFIGSNLVDLLVRRFPGRRVVSYDALTYAGNVENLRRVWEHPDHVFVRGDVCDAALLTRVFSDHAIDAVFHLAAESHVDRSILGPMAFVKTNIEGTATLLDVARVAWAGRTDSRFVHVSTDEVFGSLGETGRFSETTPYAPRSPYSASKAASDHLARAWHETYGLPVLVTNCTNNYGPYQFPEKLLPVVITRAVEEREVPVYGSGANVRDWLFVEDHCAALSSVLERGAVGETYCIGGSCEVSNLDLVHAVLDEVDRQLGRISGTSRRLVRSVGDRPGHDFRYAMDTAKIERELGWKPRVALEEGLRQTVAWYLGAELWLKSVYSDEARRFENVWYGARPAGGAALVEESSSGNTANEAT